MTHPREGWLDKDGNRRPTLTRRQLLTRAAGLASAGVAAGGLAPLLDAAIAGASAGAAAATLPLPRPSSPVTWPISKDNKAIANGLRPERNATLKLYNWVAYINQQCLDNFEKKYKCKIELTTFTTMNEALAKLQSGQFDFDVFFPTVDVLGQLVESRAVRPLNHSYISNMSQVWSDYSNPFYDQKWQYTVPYTIYTTGIAWRKDHVHENPYLMKNAWAMPWQSKYKGKVAILDDYRESISLGLMKSGIFDLNTTSQAQIATAQSALTDLAHLTNVHIDNNDYSNVPSGQIWIHHAWSGDMASAASYVPKGTPVEVVGYWFPSDGKGPVANDTMTVLRGGSNPVLAHLFLDYMLDLPNVLENISYNGYMQPLTAVTPERLVKEKILPPSLTSTAVLPSYFRKGVSELELAPAVDALWQQAWLRVSQGI